MNNRYKVYRLMCILLLIDQIIKIVIRHSLNEFQEVKIIKNFFSIIYVQNTGAAFSIMKDATLFLILLSVVFIIFLDKYIRKEESKLTKIDIITYGMIMGGIYGNLIDRIIHRKVTDYLAFDIFNYNFPVFNFADICIVLGAILMVIGIIFFKEKGKE